MFEDRVDDVAEPLRWERFAPLVELGAGVFEGCVSTFCVSRPTNVKICVRARSDCDATSATLVTCAVCEKRITPLSTLTTCSTTAALSPTGVTYPLI